VNNRIELIAHLLTEEDMANSNYIAGSMDRDTWVKTLQDIDDKLSVLGVRLGHRPWENANPGPRF